MKSLVRSVVSTLDDMDDWAAAKILQARGGRHRARRPATGILAGVVALLTATVALGGVASAAWSSSGAGGGTTNAGTVSLTATVPPVTGLYPGGSVPAAVTVHNTSGSAGLVVTSLQGGPASVQLQGKAAGCVAAGVVEFAAGALPGTVIAVGGTQTISGTVSMGTGAADTCQGAIFSVPINVTGRAG